LVAEPPAVSYERRGAAALVTIDRQHRRNAVDGPTAELLHEAYLRFEADDDARVMVLAGAGGVSFCAGADLKAQETFAGRLMSEEGPMGFTRLTPSKPTIAAISGFALAGGLDLILTGRMIDAGEALAMGMLTEVVAPGGHLDRALELAEGLARFPQRTMMADRKAAIDGFGLPLADALALEAQAGPEVYEEGARGAARFAAGEGRGGAGAGA